MLVLLVRLWMSELSALRSGLVRRPLLPPLPLCICCISLVKGSPPNSCSLVAGDIGERREATSLSCEASTVGDVLAAAVASARGLSDAAAAAAVVIMPELERGGVLTARAGFLLLLRRIAGHWSRWWAISLSESDWPRGSLLFGSSVVGARLSAGGCRYRVGRRPRSTAGPWLATVDCGCGRLWLLGVGGGRPGVGLAAAGRCWLAGAVVLAGTGCGHLQGHRPILRDLGRGAIYSCTTAVCRNSYWAWAL
jgi:hypothetical protein